MLLHSALTCYPADLATSPDALRFWELHIARTRATGLICEESPALGERWHVWRAGEHQLTTDSRRSVAAHFARPTPLSWAWRTLALAFWLAGCALDRAARRCEAIAFDREEGRFNAGWHR